MGKARVSIRTILIASFCGLTISLLALLLWLGVTVVKQNTTTLLGVVTASTMGAVSSRVEDQIEPIYKQLDYLQEQLQGDWFQQLTKKEKMVFKKVTIGGFLDPSIFESAIFEIMVDLRDTLFLSFFDL